MNQTQIIESHLKKYGSITSIEAIERYRCTRLSAKIYDLRKRGMSITTEYLNFKNPITGNDGTCARYVLED